MTPARPGGRTALVLALVVFVLLGLPEGVLGTAWASMRISLERPVGSLAWLVAGYTAGYFVSTVGAGRVQERVGVGNTLGVGVGLAAGGMVLFAAGSWWPLAVFAAFAAGLGGGTVDAAMNGYVAVAHGPRAMNMLHAMFGVGATLGPLLVTAIVSADLSWRWVYVLLALVDITLLVVVIGRRRSFEINVADDTRARTDRPIDWRILAPMLAVFVLYVSVEASYGQWSYSVLVEDRGVSPTAAGWGVALFWGGLTAGRFALGFGGHRVLPERLLTVSAAGMTAGAVLFWWDPLPAVDLVALGVVGVAAAGVFPALVLLTPTWIGVEHTGRAVGYQLAASSAGVIAVSALLGALVNEYGLDAVAPCLLAIACAMAVANLATQRIAVARRS